MSLISEIKAGVLIIVKDTALIRECKIRPDATGYICRVDLDAISIQINNAFEGYRDMQAIIPKHLFGEHFRIDPFSFSIATAYIKSRHFTKRFPQDFR